MVSDRRRPCSSSTWRPSNGSSLGSGLGLLVPQHARLLVCLLTCTELSTPKSSAHLVCVIPWRRAAWHGRTSSARNPSAGCSCQQHCWQTSVFPDRRCHARCERSRCLAGQPAARSAAPACPPALRKPPQGLTLLHRCFTVQCWTLPRNIIGGRYTCFPVFIVCCVTVCCAAGMCFLCTIPSVGHLLHSQSFCIAHMRLLHPPLHIAVSLDTPD